MTEWGKIIRDGRLTFCMACNDTVSFTYVRQTNDSEEGWQQSVYRCSECEREQTMSTHVTTSPSSGDYPR